MSKIKNFIKEKTETSRNLKNVSLLMLLGAGVYYASSANLLNTAKSFNKASSNEISTRIRDAATRYTKYDTTNPIGVKLNALATQIDKNNAPASEQKTTISVGKEK